MNLTHTRDLQTAPKNGVSYDLVPSISIINASANGTVTSDGIIVRAYRTDGSVRSANILPEDDYPDEGDYYFAEYSKDGGSWTRCDKFYYPTGPSDDIEWLDKYGIGYAVVESAKKGIAFRLKHSSDTNKVLKEIPPIEVVKDGTDAVDVICDVKQINVRCSSSGNAIGFGGSTSLSLMAKNGSTAYCSSVSIVSKPSGVSTLTHADVIAIPGYGLSFSVTAGTSKNDFEGNLVIEVVGTVNNITYTKQHVLSVVAQITGEQGKRGRWYYWGGNYVQGTEYTGNDTQAPYVLFEWTENNQLKSGAYMLVGNTNKVNGTYIAPRTAAAEGIWERMETDFKFLIAEVIFSAFAKLGSAVFSGDWMISQYGTVNGVHSTSYQQFDTSDPEGLTSGHFRPNYAINLLTGKAYLGDAVLTGILRTKAIYTINGSIKTVSGRQTVDLTDNAGNAYVLPDNTTVYLPEPTSFEGLELTIIFSAGSVLTCDTDFYMAYYTGTTTVQANGMSVKAFHSPEGLSVLTVKAIRAYGSGNGVRWVVVGQRGILGIRNYVDGADSYELCPDGRLVI